MGKRRKKSRETDQQRDYQRNARRVRLLYDNRPLLVDDRRLWAPGPKPFLMQDGRPVTYEDTGDDRNEVARRRASQVGFVSPRQVRVCQKRKARKEILFARGKAGKGKKIRGRRRYRESSKIKC